MREIRSENPSHAACLALFAEHLERWTLVQDGAPIATCNSRLLPVRRGGVPAMLKLCAEGERFAAATLRWWDGDGAVRLLAQHGAVVLIDRATGTGSLAAMARGGQDDQACRVLCDVAARLHAPRPAPPPSLLPLAKRYDLLHATGATQGGLLRRCADTAAGLLAAPIEPGVLHGDLRHDNVLDFGPRGWLAIDPKGLFGERGSDLANLFTNPDLSDATRPVASEQGRLAQRLGLVAAVARLERQRLLRWVLAWAGLSASLIITGGNTPTVSLRMAELAAAAIDC